MRVSAALASSVCQQRGRIWGRVRHRLAAAAAGSTSPHLCVLCSCARRQLLVLQLCVWLVCVGCDTETCCVTKRVLACTGHRRPVAASGRGHTGRRRPDKLVGVTCAAGDRLGSKHDYQQRIYHPHSRPPTAHEPLTCLHQGSHLPRVTLRSRCESWHQQNVMGAQNIWWGCRQPQLACGLCRPTGCGWIAAKQWPESRSSPATQPGVELGMYSTNLHAPCRAGR